MVMFYKRWNILWNRIMVFSRNILSHRRLDKSGFCQPISFQSSANIKIDEKVSSRFEHWEEFLLFRGPSSAILISSKIYKEIFLFVSSKINITCGFCFSLEGNGRKLLMFINSFEFG